MDIIQALTLGVVQGLTEYLPVSSSAHLVLVPLFLDWHFTVKQAFVFDVLVQLGTLVGVIAYFFKDLLQIAQSMWRGLVSGKPLKEPEAQLGWLVGLATVPAAVFGILLKDYIEAFFESPRFVMAFLLLTAGVLTLCEFRSKHQRTVVKLWDSIWMGFAQVSALLPGMSRSGMTISVGVFRGLSKESAARFSFLMSIPVMLGAALVAFKDLSENLELLEQMLVPILVGALAAAISGYIVIYWFLRFLKKQSLLWFALYCALVGGGGLLLS